MQALLGIDAGTTSAKALVLGLSGEVLGLGRHVYSISRVNHDGYEQDPGDLWDGVVKACQQALAGIPAGTDIGALALSAQAGTTIPVDDTGAPMRMAISWMDHRGKSYMDRVTGCLPAGEIYRRSGWQLTPASAMMHIIRLRQEEPDVFSRTCRFLFVSDFLVSRMTGTYCLDPSSAGITGLYNVRSSSWDPKLLHVAGIGERQLSPIWPSGQVIGRLSSDAAQALGLGPETLVVNGAHDQYCAALGAGTDTPGDVMLSAGTAWVLLSVFTDVDSAFRTDMAVSSYPIPGLWGALGTTGAVGKAVTWFSDQVLAGRAEDAYQWMNGAVPTSPPGANGLIFVAPAVAKARGCLSGFINLDIDHTLADMARAVMECTAYEVKRVMGGFERSGMNATRLIMVGRPASNQAWAQVLADVLGLPLFVPDISEAASFGAAILAGMGTGVIEPEVIRAGASKPVVYQPDEARMVSYEQEFSRYLSVVDRVS